MDKITRRAFLKLLSILGIGAVASRIPVNEKPRAIPMRGAQATLGFGEKEMDSNRILASVRHDSDVLNKETVIAMCPDFHWTARHKFCVSDAYKRYADSAERESLTEIEKQIAVLNYTIDNEWRM